METKYCNHGFPMFQVCDKCKRRQPLREADKAFAEQVKIMVSPKFQKELREKLLKIK